MPPLPRAARAFVLVVGSAGFGAFGVVLLLAVLQRPEPGDLWLCALLVGLTLVGEGRPIVVARGDRRDEITVSSTFALALVLVGPLWLALVAMCTAVALQDLRLRKGPVKTVFNVAQYVLTLLAAAAVHAALSGGSLLAADRLEVPGQLPAALLAGVAFFAVNNSIIGIVTALAGGGPVLPHLREDVGFQVGTSGVLLSFAPVVVAGGQLTLWLLPLLLLPMGAIHRSAQLAADREHEALHDPLTGLPNRSLFRLRVSRACEEAGRSGSRLAVVLLDLDHFKEVNDTLGHQVGDDLLRVVARRLEQSAQPSDTVARLGGDEFVVLVVDLPDDAAGMTAAQRLLNGLRAPFEVDDVQLEVGASAGVALSPLHGDAVDLLLQHADIALYSAKVERGRASVYDPEEDSHTPERLLLATELRLALERGELFLEHQPQVALDTGRVVGFEALVRWRHPQRGVLMPDAFLPVVEGTRLIGPLTLVVLDLALAAVARWRARGHDLTVAVNLSVRHLTDLGLPVEVGLALRRHGLPPRALVLEVTETLIMADPARAAEVLGLLRDLGVGIAVDDFGTGYSSLAYLRRLHLNELKIDRSFVSSVTSAGGDAVIVRSTIDMGRNLGLRLVAEGVEDEATMDLLRSWGCDVAQGYHVSRPLPAASVLSWLEHRPAAGQPAPLVQAGRC